MRPVTVCLSPETIHALEALADAQGTTLGKMARQILEETTNTEATHHVKEKEKAFSVCAGAS